MEAIKAFGEKVRKAGVVGTNEIRISTKEAMALMVDINSVLADLAAQNRKLRETEELVGKSIVLDGGDLSKK